MTSRVIARVVPIAILLATRGIAGHARINSKTGPSRDGRVRLRLPSEALVSPELPGKFLISGLQSVLTPNYTAPVVTFPRELREEALTFQTFTFVTKRSLFPHLTAFYTLSNNCRRSPFKHRRIDDASIARRISSDATAIPETTLEKPVSRGCLKRGYRSTDETGSRRNPTRQRTAA
jgi:hypothetical protein